MTQLSRLRRAPVEAAARSAGSSGAGRGPATGRPAPSDVDLLGTAARRLGVDPLTLMRRYYGSSEDARLELTELDRTGQLQASLARLLREELCAAAGTVAGPGHQAT